MVKLVYTPDLGSGASRCKSSSLFIRTTTNTSETPILSYNQTLWETFDKLNQTEKLLKKLSLYNEKYLLNRNGIYYFVIRFNESIIFKKSLHTSNLTLGILLKLKILYRLSKMGFVGKGYTTFIGKNSLNLVAENETEEKLLKEIEKTIVNKIKRLKTQQHSVNIETDEIRDTNSLKKLTDEYIKYREKVKTSVKVMYKFKQCIEFLNIYFGEKKLVKDITQKDNMDFQLFLLSIPSDWKKKKDLVGKDLKLIYEKTPKMLDKYEKLKVSTVNEIIKKVITIFEYFEENTYIYKNPFKKVGNGIKRVETEKREFSESELKRIFFYLNTKDLIEEYRFMKFLLYCGLRREEGLIPTVGDIDFEKSLIEIDGKKTKNSKRISIIHKDIVDDLKIQMDGKNSDDYLFFNIKLTNKYRSEKIGTKLNGYIKDVVGEETKKVVDLHSFRKNFSQTISLSGFFSDLEIKTLVGHSTKSDVTDTHYIRGKRNWKTLKERIDKVDFSIYFSSSDFLPI